MKTELIEFKNSDKETLRGILLNPEAKSSSGVIFIGGFERSSTTEPKFKDLADRLYRLNIPSLRFDFTGLGLSDGDFKKTTVDRWVDEFSYAYRVFRDRTGVDDIYVACHSLGACVLGEYLKRNPGSIDRAVLIAPALNQRDLMRYWFVSGQMKKKGLEVSVDWGNYLNYFNEGEFEADVNREDKMSKYNFIGSAYFKECSKADFFHCFKGYEDKFLHVHGLKDAAVPIESLNIDFKNKVIVDSGNHYMERPDQRVKWIGKAAEYLSFSG